jgi:hypothetical protein
LRILDSGEVKLCLDKKGELEAIIVSEVTSGKDVGEKFVRRSLCATPDGSPVEYYVQKVDAAGKATGDKEPMTLPQLRLWVSNLYFE